MGDPDLIGSVPFILKSIIILHHSNAANKNPLTNQTSGFYQ